MKHTSAIIIGAGHSGLAMSHELTKSGVDHLIIERGQAGNSWRTERWDSLRLLTPNWMNGLHGQRYTGVDQDGFMTMTDLVQQFDRYATQSNAPILSDTTVVSVDRPHGIYRVQTDQGLFTADRVVMANGACALPKTPGFASEVPAHIQSITPHRYKRPSQLLQGKVLVVGASASGLQLAREIQQSGRQVVLAVGNHLRFPRHYRDADITRWMERLGTTRTPYTQVDDIDRVRRTPSLTLVAEETIDLNILQDMGVEITGRLATIQQGRALFSGALANCCASADLKMNRLLGAIDHWIEAAGMTDFVAGPERYAPTQVPLSPRLSIDLAAEGFGSVVWATGYRPDFNWLKLPVFDRKGNLAHDGGVVADGLYAMGLPYLRQRKSTFIGGAADDARALSAHLIAGLALSRAA